MTQRSGFVPSSTAVAAIAVLTLTVGWTPVAEADITRIVIARVESPTFEGVSFGAVGPIRISLSGARSVRSIPTIPVTP